jgi:hypothetical protein
MNRLPFIAGVLVLTVAVQNGTVLHAQEAWGNIKGRVVWGGKVLPERMALEKVKDHADKAHCLKNGDVLDEEWVVDKKSRGLRWTIVWLINDPAKKGPLPIHPDLVKIDKLKVEVDQPVCAFTPHSMAIRVGQVLVVKNSSPVSHSCKWDGAKNQGNRAVAAGQEIVLKDLAAEKFPMPISCASHTWMKGYVGIFDHPYFAVTDAEGNFEIKNAPAGTFRLVAHNNIFLGGAKGRLGLPIVIPAGETVNVGDLAFAP